MYNHHEKHALALPETRQKLRETRFFLGHLRHEARRTAGDPEPVRHYLSACLNACRSVTFVLQNEANPKQRANYDQLKAGLDLDEQSLLAFMNMQRTDEVHKTGAAFEVGERRIIVDSVYEDEFGRWEVFAALVASANEPVAQIIAPAYDFRIDKYLCDVTDTFTAYVDLLDRLVRQIEESDSS